MITCLNACNDTVAAGMLRFSHNKTRSGGEEREEIRVWMVLLSQQSNQAILLCVWLKDVLATATLTFYWWESQTALGHLWVTFHKVFSLQLWKWLFFSFADAYLVAVCFICVVMFSPVKPGTQNQNSYNENNYFNVIQHSFLKEHKIKKMNSSNF